MFLHKYLKTIKMAWHIKKTNNGWDLTAVNEG